MSQWEPVGSIARKVQAREAKALDLVNQSLEAIKAKPQYQAIISTTEQRALKRAAEIDKRIENGEDVGLLAGVPFIAKDNFLAYGAETTAASNILKGFNAPYQATAIEKLESEGAICVAKANLDAFAHGSSTENSDFMTTKNPHNKDFVPGGSSGGSAAAVVLEMAPFALGTDTGGSIRLPASFCGCVGLKPTYGLVSRSGVIAMASSADVVGPLTNSVDDASAVLNVLAGKDSLDSTTISRAHDDYTKLEPIAPNTKVGIVKEYMSEALEPEVKACIDDSVNKLISAGAKITEISLPSLPLALACYYIIVPAEISSNLSRYDGQHFGFSHKDAASVEESYKKTRSIGFGKEAKRRIMMGSYVLSSGYYDAYYKKAQRLRTKLIQEFDQAFGKVDFLIGPTSPTTAFKIGQNTNDPLKMYLTDIMTVSANLTGIPAVSIPAGKHNGLPVGLQIMAKQGDDKELLELAKTIEGVA